jgi:hypothetical protein
MLDDAQPVSVAPFDVTDALKLPSLTSSGPVEEKDCPKVGST